MDDDHSMIRLVSGFLRDMNCQTVVEARNGEEAMPILSGRAFDLLIFVAHGADRRPTAHEACPAFRGKPEPGKADPCFDRPRGTGNRAGRKRRRSQRGRGEAGFIQ